MFFGEGQIGPGQHVRLAGPQKGLEYAGWAEFFARCHHYQADDFQY